MQRDPSDDSGRPWPVQLHELAIGGMPIRMELVRHFDDVLDDMATRHPDDTDMIPYFADLWPSAVALAGHLAERYPDLDGTTLIELGCGAGLPSIVAARLGATVTATDFHPRNRPYFEANARRNGVPQIHYRTMDWRHPPADATYGMILGSDLLYEAPQSRTLCACIQRLLRPGGIAILADPGRKHLQQASDQLQDLGFHPQLDTRGEILILTFRRDAQEQESIMSTG